MICQKPNCPKASPSCKLTCEDYMRRLRTTSSRIVAVDYRAKKFRQLHAVQLKKEISDRGGGR